MVVGIRFAVAIGLSDGLLLTTIAFPVCAAGIASAELSTGIDALDGAVRVNSSVAFQN